MNPQFTNPGNVSQTESSVYDRNGNEVTAMQESGYPTLWMDTLGQVALSASGTGTPSSPLDFTWNNAGGQAENVTVNYQDYNIRTNFGCSGISEYSAANVPLVSSIVLADGSKYSFTYEPTPNYSGDTTDRLDTITLPTGGTITYSYGSMNCATGEVSSLTRTMPNGDQWMYAYVNSGSSNTVTVTDPNNNNTVYSFSSNGYMDATQSYNGAVAPGNLLLTKIYCYNATATPAGSAAPGSCGSAGYGEVTSLDTYTEQGGLQAESVQTFDSLGNVTEEDDYDFGSGVIGAELRSVITAYASFSNSYGNFEAPSSTEITSGGASGTLEAKTTYAYDQNGLQTAGASQLVGVGAVRSNPTTITYYTAGSATIARTFNYYDTGEIYQATDINGAVTTFNYSNSSASCDYAFPTSISLPLNQSVSYSYNCGGGVPTSATDVNGNTTQYSYGNDPYWRLATITDPIGNAVNETYTADTSGNAPSLETSMNFGAGSTEDQLVTFDNLGRPVITQTRQAPNVNDFDSVQTIYTSVIKSFTLKPAIKNTIAYTGTAGQSGPGTYASTELFDPLGRPAELDNGAGGALQYSFPVNDALATAGSPTVSKQTQYNALGWLTIVCEISSGLPQAGGCGQNAAATGIATDYAHNALGEITQVTENAQDAANQQNRYMSYDLLGRLISESNPENGTTYYYYDSTPSGSACGSYTSAGDLVESVDGAGNATCYQYDADHRVTQISYAAANQFSAAPDKYFVYDSANLSGTVMTNAEGRLAEAYTGSHNTDEFYSYDADGRMVKVWEKTPNSSGYQEVSAAYYANGVPSQLSVPGPVPAISYSLDGEGRINGVTANGTNLLSSAGYAIGSANLVTTLDYGSGDSDTATISLASGEPGQYQFAVNGGTDTGTLSWNSNGTLLSLDIADQLNSSDTQNCTFTYDDLGRLGGNTGNAGVNCGGNWAQDFSFDSFGNISTSGSLSFQPSNYGNNKIQGWSLNGQPIAYNLDGDIIQDPFHTFTWFASNELDSVDSDSLVHDALGRVVEIDGSSDEQVLYAPLGGKIAEMTGSTLDQAWIPLADGAEAVYNSSGFAYYRHPDWLGSSRLATTQQRGVYFDTAYAPYGAAYDSSGTADLDFTGHNSLITNPNSSEVLSDFMFREYSSLEGRWIQPDPAGLAAVNPADPQSWNRYAYVGNQPEQYVDLFGLKIINQSGGCTYNTDTNTVNCPYPPYVPLPPGAYPSGSCQTYVDGQCAGNPDPCANGDAICNGPFGSGNDYGNSGGGVIGSLPNVIQLPVLQTTSSQKNCGLSTLGSFGVHAGLDALGLIPGEKAAQLVFGGGMPGLAAWNNSMFAVAGVSAGFSVSSGDQLGAGLGFADLAVSAAQQSASLVAATGEILPGANVLITTASIGYDAYNAFNQYLSCSDAESPW